MGTSYEGGVVYGYYVTQEDFIEAFGEEMDTYEVSEAHGVRDVWAGNMYGSETEVVFTTKGNDNYKSTFYGFREIDLPTMQTDDNLDRFMELVDGKLGLWAFQCVG